MKLFITTLFLLATVTLFSQKSISSSWSVDFKKSKSFIENKGQFDQDETPSTGKIRFAFDQGSTRIYFGDRGVAYKFIEIDKKSREQRAAIMAQKVSTVDEYKQREKLHGKFLVRKDQVNMQFVDANDAVQIVGINEAKDYHSYSFTNKEGKADNINFIKGFEKIVYKNIYPKIDIEYQVHPIVGIKYAFHVQPGADPSVIKMLYDREVILRNGEIFISTSFGDLIDHAPISFYNDNHDNSISSKYSLVGKTVSFELGSYDKSKSLVIDPWVQTPNFPLNWDCVWELDTDAAGNVYVIGGVDPLQLIKYNSAGVLQWTYNTPYDTTAWLGTMATDDLGNSYVTNGTDYKILKVNTTGGVVWNNNAPTGGGLNTEFWNISFNCDQTKLIVGGTGGFIRGEIYEVDMNSGNIVTSVPVSANSLTAIPPQIQEVRAMCAAPNGKYYFVTLDTIGKMNDNLTLCPAGSSSFLEKNHGVNWGYKAENWRYSNTGIKVIRADKNFVYTHKGNALQKRSLVDFSIIGSVNIPGGVLAAPFLSDNVTENAGIDIDDCGNIYVGSKTGVYKFNSALVQQAFYATSFIVYDVRVSTSGDIVACGGSGDSNASSRTGGVQSFAAAACVPIAITCCDATICQPQTVCVSDPAFTLTVGTAGGTFSGPGVNAATGLFTPSVAGPGTHAITYTLACGSETINIVVSACAALTVCKETNNTLTVSGGTGPYSWESFLPAGTTPITNAAQCTSCSGSYTWNSLIGQCLNGFTPVSSCNSPAGYANYASGTNAAQPPTWPLQVLDGSGGSVTYANLAAIPSCSACPTINISITSQTNVTCNGGNNGAATVSASGGTAAYTYSWTPGPLSGATQSSLTAQAYTVTATDANSCTGTTTVTITQPAALVAPTASVTTQPTCATPTGTITVTAPAPAAGVTYTLTGTAPVVAPQINATGVFTGLAPGSYTVSATVNGCTSPTTALTVNPLPSAPAAPTASITVQPTCATPTGTLTVSVPAPAAGTTYTVTGTAPVVAPQTNATGVFTGLTPGNYDVTVTVGGCTSTATPLTVNSVVGAPTITVNSQNDASCFGASDGSVSITANGAVAPYTYAWSPSGGNAASATNLAAGTYTVTVTDNVGCSSAQNITIGSPTQIIVNGVETDVDCSTATLGSIATNPSGGTGPYTYAWTPSGNTASISNLSAGNYSVTVTDANGCTQNQSFTVGSVGSAVITATPVSATIEEGEFVQLTAVGGTSYTWTPATGLSCTDCSSPIASPTVTTTYIVTGTNAIGCLGADTVTVYVNQLCGDIYVPTVFSPNGTGPSENNMLCIKGGCIAELKYAIYNRWGEKVFETTDLTRCWDGTWRGKDLNSGVFAYKLEVTLMNGNFIEESGNVTLIR